ncbi:MAG: oxidoreductase, partial [Betaproteobacteria bacterium]
MKRATPQHVITTKLVALRAGIKQLPPVLLIESAAFPTRPAVKKMTSVLFSPIELRGLRLANRIVVSPMCQYMSEDGSANDWHLMHLGQFAMGAGGLLITEATHV